MYPQYKKFVKEDSDKKLTPTPSDIEGPFYKADAPIKKSLDAHPNLHIHGRVYNTDGELLPGCTLDFWQANATGVYDMEGFNYRGKVETDANGSFALDTIVPGDYAIGPNEYRCSHVHVKVSAKGYKLLTTQLYFEDDKYDNVDGWFNPQMVIGKPDAVFNFVLDKSTPAIDILPYTYVMLTGTTVLQINGSEDAIKALFISGKNRLFRIYSSFVYHSTEEYNGTGWIMIPAETL